MNFYIDDAITLHYIINSMKLNLFLSSIARCSILILIVSLKLDIMPISKMSVEKLQIHRQNKVPEAVYKIMSVDVAKTDSQFCYKITLKSKGKKFYIICIMAKSIINLFQKNLLSYLYYRKLLWQGNYTIKIFVKGNWIGIL